MGFKCKIGLIRGEIKRIAWMCMHAFLSLSTHSRSNRLVLFDEKRDRRIYHGWCGLH